LRDDHVARSGAAQHGLDVARIVGKVDARYMLADEAISGEIRVGRATIFNSIVNITKVDGLFELIISAL